MFGQPAHAHSYVCLARTDDVWYKQTNKCTDISSCSNTRWGSLRLTSIISQTTSMCVDILWLTLSSHSMQRLEWMSVQ